MATPFYGDTVCDKSHNKAFSNKIEGAIKGSSREKHYAEFDVE